MTGPAAPRVDAGPVPRFRILGPVELWIGDEATPPPPGDRLRLLAGLVAAWGRPVLRDDLVELVWGEDPPDGAAGRLPPQMSRLRTHLRQHHPELTIEARGGGYALVTGPATLDREAFAEHLHAVHRAEASDDLHRVVHAADQGLALWRGPAFGSLADLPVLRPHAVHLDEQRAVMIELRAAALLALGDLRTVVADLAAAVSESPLREELRRLLMVALARSGRQVEATRTFDDYRRALVDIGLEPSAGLERLRWRILDNDPLLVSGAGSPDHRGEAIMLPPELTVASPVTVGRHAARDELRAALARVAGGGRGIVLLRGEAGVGKSHLAAALAREAHDAGAVVLAGTADAGVQAPLGPIVRALRFYREHAGADGDEQLAPWWGELSRLLPEVPREEPITDAELDPRSARARLFDAVAGWLGTVGTSTPLVLVLEDLHWADETTLGLLDHLARSASLPGVLVLATIREPEPEVSPLVDDVVSTAHRSGTLLADLTLEGLDVDEVADLVGELRSDLADVAPVLAQDVVERTNGNPLFVIELLSDLPLARSGEAVAEGAPPRLGTPPSAHHLVARRLRQLDPLARRVLADAALLGDELAFDLLTDVTGLRPDAVLQALDDPIDMGLLVHLPAARGRLRFSHAVVRDALVERLRPAERADGHRRAAEAILALPPVRRRALVEELARHAWEAALVLGPASVVPFLVDAGDQSVQRRAYGHAVGWFGRALELADLAALEDGPGDPDGPPSRFDLLCARGGARRQAGDPAAREDILSAAGLATDAGDADALARAALLGTRGFFRQTAVPDHEWIEVLEGAVAVAPADGPARGLLAATLASELVWADPEGRRFRLSDEAVAAARQAGSPTVLAQVLLLRLVTTWAPDTLDDRQAVADELLTLTGRTGDLAVRCHALRFAAACAIERGDRASAEGHFAACVSLTEELAQPDLAWHLALAEAGWTLLDGDLDAAARAAVVARVAGERAGEPEALAFAGAVELEVLRRRGTAASMVDFLAEAFGDLPPDPAFGLHRHLAATGHVDLVRDTVLDAATDPSAIGRGVHTLAALSNLADVVGRLADREAATALAAALGPYADHFPQAIVVQPVVHHHLGVLAAVRGDAAAADAHFTAAVDRHRDFGAPLHEAATLLAWGTHRDRPDLVDAGRTLALGLGAPGLVAEAGA